MQSQKFLDFWGWNILPWNEPVNLDTLFWQERTTAVASRLVFSLAHAAHIFVITAPPGHGKSTFVHWLYHHLDPKTHDVALFSLVQKETQGTWLIPRLGHYLGLDQNDTRSVIQHLHKAQVQGQVLSIIIDEAHKLSLAEAFDEILALSHPPSRIAHGINFVLIGNPQLLSTIQTVEGIRHRLSLCTELQSLHPDELLSYVRQRLETLRLPPKTIGPEAVEIAIQHGIGIFAAAESLLETCLVEAFLRDQRIVSPDVMTAAIQFLGLQKPTDDSTHDELKSRNAVRRRLQSSPTPRAAAAPNAALDLNSLYYKSGGGHDPEQS